MKGFQQNRPFLLKPVGKDYLWGGSRLKDDFGKEEEMEPLAETWECSTHPDGVSMVASGEYKGRLLSRVLEEHPEFIGNHPKSHRNLPPGQIPILVKLIDAKEALSVQVHPDDEYARTHEQGQLGKSEMWYVLDTTKEAKLIYGLKREISQEKLKQVIHQGKLEKYLQYIPVKKNDVFYVKAGMIHGVGAGILLAEIQENSNLTYRLYDFERTDKEGKRRRLQIDKALETADLHRTLVPRQPMRILKYRPGCAVELLGRCKYFQLERVLLNTERVRKLVTFYTGSDSFEVFLCIEGCGELISWGMMTPFFKGDCIFVPANSIKFELHGIAQLLKIIC